MPDKPRVLVACEESGTVVDAFMRRWGGSFEVYSCDLLPTSGKHPDRHIVGDAHEVCKMDWDLVIAHPPCTAIAVSGARWFEEKKRNGQYYEGMGLFLFFTALDHVPHVAVENPVSAAASFYRPPDFYTQPYQFGHMEQKKTSWWVKDLPALRPTNDVYEKMMELPRRERERVHNMSPGPERGKERSKTYRGLADAIADQWGAYVLGETG